jgi:hypothetical protein
VKSVRRDLAAGAFRMPEHIDLWDHTDRRRIARTA